MIKQILLLGLVGVVVSYPFNDVSSIDDLEEYGRKDLRNAIVRERRFVSQVQRPRPGQVFNPPIPRPQGPQTSINPSIRTDKAGTTNAGVDINHKRPGAEINAHIDQNIRGPGKSSKPNWHIEATIH